MEQQIQIILQQLETLLIVLERPVVQRQLLASLGVLLGAILLSHIVRRWLRARNIGNKPIPLPRRASKVYASQVLDTLLTPVLAILLGYLVALLFMLQGYPAQLVTNALNLVWLWIGYSLLLTLLYALFGPAARPYHRRILLPLLIGVLVLGIWSNFINLQVIGEIPLFTFLGTEVTIGRLFSALLALYVFFTLSWIVREVITVLLSRRPGTDPGVAYSVAVISSYTIIALGILAALRSLGADLTTLAVVGGGLSVGIGIGLQSIAANFISGIMLLFEQSLRPGDVIDLNGELGIVEKLDIRATQVRTINNVELIVPNETFVTTQVRTYTKSNRTVRLLLPLGVSYDSDPKQVRQIITETAVRHGQVLNEPAPILLFRGFGDSSLDFELGVWIDEPRLQMRIRSDLYYMIWEALAKNNIEIPFPQRDLNLRRGWDKLDAGPPPVP